MNLRRVAAVAGKEWREIVRDRIVAALAFLLAPTVMLVLGYGMVEDLEHVPLAIVDHDRSAASRDYAQHVTATRYFRYAGHAGDRDADRLLADGVVRVVLVIPEQFGETLAEGRAAAVQALVDGTFTRTARTVKAYLEAINAEVSRDLEVEHLAARLGVTRERAETLMAPLRMEVRYLYNQEARSLWGIGPSLVMFTLTLVTPLLTALNVVREKESGAIYNVYASTISRAEFLAGKLVPNVAVGCANGAVLWALAVVVFGVPFKGSLLFLIAATAVYVVTAAAAGLLISLLVASQQAALAISIILTMIIAIQYSGMITPLSSLTGATWLLARALPVSHYTTIVQGTFLKGAGLAELWTPALAIAAHAALMLAAAWLLFRKRVRA
ncbi:MAG: ABC transporter permease [Candidatus Rokubacteria bacterium]|nr:ABC transporter permease [Candidatus Rokubacteria bacterium]